MSLSYNMQDWFLDVCDKSRCLSCRGFTIERVDSVTAQCYSCGRWYDGYEMGRAFSDLVHLSTTHQEREKRRQHRDDPAAMNFEQELSYAPGTMENVGSYPGDEEDEDE